MNVNTLTLKSVLLERQEDGTYCWTLPSLFPNKVIKVLEDSSSLHSLYVLKLMEEEN